MYYTDTEASAIIDNPRLYYCVLRRKGTYILLWCKDAAGDLLMPQRVREAAVVYADQMVYIGSGQWRLIIGQTPVAAHRMIHRYYHTGHIHRGWCACGCAPEDRYEGRE